MSNFNSIFGTRWRFENTHKLNLKKIYIWTKLNFNVNQMQNFTKIKVYFEK